MSECVWPPLCRMPPGQKDAPILLLDCDSEFETNAEKAAEHMQKVRGSRSQRRWSVTVLFS